MSNISEHSDDIDWEKDPDWESEIVKGPKLAECIKDLFRNHHPDEVAKVRGYFFIVGFLVYCGIVVFGSIN